jgi:MFS family permease
MDGEQAAPRAPGRARGAVRAIAVDITPFRVSRDYRRIWWAELLSQIGSQITVVAVFIQVYRLTNSAAAVGIVGLVQLVPLTVATIVGGPLIDRLDRRKILLVTQGGLVAMSAVLLVASTLHKTPLWLVYLPVGLAAGFSGVASPTRGSIVPNLIPLELLSSAVALNQVMWNAAMVAGPALGGIIIASSKVHGLTFAYAVDVASFAATIYVTLRLPAQLPKDQAEQPSTGARAIRDAFRFLKGKHVLQATFVVDLVAMIFGLPRALFPILAVKQFHRGPEIVGAMFSAIAVGAVVGASTAGWVSRVRRQGFAVLIAVALWGACIALFGTVHVLVLAFILLAFAGAADVISAVFRGTILQSMVTDAFRGRLTAIHILVVTGGPRLGDLEAGLVASAFTPAISVVSGGIACIAGVLVIAVLIPQFAAYVVPEEQRKI